MTGTGYSNWDADSFGSFSLSADDSVNLGLIKYLSASEGGGIRYARDRQGRVSLNVPNFAKWYSQVYADFGFQAALASDWDLLWHGASYTWPWAAVYGKERGNIKHYNYIDANPSIRKDGLEYILTWTGGGNIWGYSWNMNEPLFGLQLGVSQYDMDSDEESYSWMKNALLRRRTFSNDLNLTAAMAVVVLVYYVTVGIAKKKFKFFLHGFSFVDIILALVEILEMDWDTFLETKKWHSRMQAWNLSLTQKVCEKCKVIYSRN